MRETVTADGCAATQAQRPFTILIAEDSTSNQALLSLYLKGNDHRLTFAKDGLEAVNAFKSTGYDLVLMDIVMPCMDGHEAIRAIRAFERENRLQPVPIVAISANTGSEDRECSAGAGCTDFLAKPFRKAEFLDCVRRNLTNR